MKKTDNITSRTRKIGTLEIHGTHGHDSLFLNRKGRGRTRKYLNRDDATMQEARITLTFYRASFSSRMRCDSVRAITKFLIGNRF
jgi:hypothetical protein